MAVTTTPSYCRFCHSCCPILVDVDGGVPVKVRGDRDNELFGGYTCVKGRQLPEQHTHPDRLLHSQKRQPNGTYAPIPVEQAMDEIAAKIGQVLADHGPLAVANYGGTYGQVHPATAPMQIALMNAIDSPRRFTAMTIDQPGKAIAKGLLGIWLAPPQGFDDADVGLIIGANPLVAVSGGLPNVNPRQWLKKAQQRGYRLMVIDPRVTETARKADIHLQPRPGTDIPLVAAILRVIIDESLYDHDFVASDVGGLDDLRRAVEPFTPEAVAALADVDADEIVTIARTFAAGPRGVATAGTGPNMSAAAGTLLEYLLLCLNTICGRWLTAGEKVWNPGTLVEPFPAMAMAFPPVTAYGFGQPLRVRGLADSLAGPSTAAVADEILLDGPERIRVLMSCGGNPVAAWPDQRKVVEALDSLEMLVQIDPWMSATARRADYVIAPKLSLEMPAMTSLFDMLPAYAPGFGWNKPHAQYTPAVVEPPEGSDVIAEWEFFFGLARRLGLELSLRPIDMNGPTGTAYPIDMSVTPDEEELFELLTAKARVPLETVKRHPHGAVFESDIHVAEKDAGWEHRLDVGNAQMLTDLADVAREMTADASTWAGADYPFRVISRRMFTRYNSGGHTLDALTEADPQNPAYMHPDDLAAIGVVDGDAVEVSSPRATVRAVAGVDPGLRRGLVSMTHAWGDADDLDDEPAGQAGASTARLSSVGDAYDRYSGQPVMSNIPVSVRPARN
ncbi:molybdopterin dinucleotide binding domain-containing protein [uncultured Williamsia sp.]|uniref:molybdopterin-containing oxidoreductase family protein n=1 Tax=uncultured Williamsia sp. TaxID=259311 RepID=UPI002625D869|nr:molybdopterin dinucleotide binding domain-containing protein [uncultured Williamsia sp.]